MPPCPALPGRSSKNTAIPTKRINAFSMKPPSAIRLFRTLSSKPSGAVHRSFTPAWHRRTAMCLLMFTTTIPAINLRTSPTSGRPRCWQSTSQMSCATHRLPTSSVIQNTTGRKLSPVRRLSLMSSPQAAKGSLQGNAGSSKENEDCGAQTILDGTSKAKAEQLMSDEQLETYKDFLSAKAYQAFALRRRDSKYITATLKESHPMLEISPRDLDADCFALCTPAATYDLRKGLAGAREHSPEDFITKITAVSPSSKGEQIWLDCLDLIFCGNQELIDYVQMISGCVIGRLCGTLNKCLRRR